MVTKLTRAMDEAEAALKAEAPIDPEKLTRERGTIHGPADKQFITAQGFKTIIRHAAEERARLGYPPLDAVTLEALEMDAVKTSRILWGNPEHADHWDDKIGYSHLGKTKGRNTV